MDGAIPRDFIALPLGTRSVDTGWELHKGRREGPLGVKAAEKSRAGANPPASARTFRGADQPASVTSWRLRCARSDVATIAESQRAGIDLDQLPGGVAQTKWLAPRIRPIVARQP